jgi:hypothetical protein
MGRTKQFPCPSAVLLTVVATKPYYTIVPVFVKGHCLLLDMSRLGMCVLVLLGGIFSAFGGSHSFHCPRRASLGVVLWERGWNLAQTDRVRAQGARYRVLAPSPRGFAERLFSRGRPTSQREARRSSSSHFKHRPFQSNDGMILQEPFWTQFKRRFLTSHQ